MSLTVEVPADLESFVVSKVESGDFTDADALIAHALRLLQSAGTHAAMEENEGGASLRKAIDKGWSSAQNGHLMTETEVKADLVERKRAWMAELGLA